MRTSTAMRNESECLAHVEDSSSSTKGNAKGAKTRREDKSALGMGKEREGGWEEEETGREGGKGRGEKIYTKNLLNMAIP